MNGVHDAPLGLLSFLSFAFSVIAAVLAIDMYKLLRTGEFGKTWRLLITASVMLALLQVLRMAEALRFRPIVEAHLSEIVELCFVMSLAYAFYLQRKLFGYEDKSAVIEDADLIADEDSMLSEDDHPESIFEEYDDHAGQEKNSSQWSQFPTSDPPRPAP